MKWKILIVIMVVLMPELVNATTITPTLSGIQFDDTDDYLKLDILPDVAQAYSLGSNIRNNSYFPYYQFIFNSSKFNTTPYNITTTDINGINTTTTITPDETLNVNFNLTFNRNIAKEYIEGWDWNKISLGEKWWYRANFKCNVDIPIEASYSNPTSDSVKINVAFNFSSIANGTVIQCEDQIYSILKFYEPANDISQWTKTNNSFSILANATDSYFNIGGSTTANISTSFDVDMSDCVYGTAMANWTTGRRGAVAISPTQCLRLYISNDSGVTYPNNRTIFCGDSPPLANGTNLSNITTLTNFMRFRFVANLSNVSVNMTIGNFNITCNSSVSAVSQCGNLNSPNVQYNLRTNVNSTGTCFNITANNDTLDCHGNNINYSTGIDVQQFGIDIQSRNLTIARGCNIFVTPNKANLQFGIDISNSNYTIIFNNTFIHDNAITTGVIIVNINNFPNTTNINISNNTIFILGGTKGSMIGINLGNVTNSYITNNKIYINLTDNAANGIYEGFLVRQNSNNILIDNNFVNGTQRGTSNSMDGIRFSTNPSFITFSNNIINLNNTLDNGNVGSTWGGITIISGYNLTFINNNISSYKNIVTINGTITSNNNNIVTNLTFINNTFICQNSSCNAFLLTANTTNIFLINTNFNKSQVLFVPRSIATPTEKNNITVQWYLNLNVTNSSNGNAIANANVTINSSNNFANISTFTNTNGNIPMQIITEYTQNGSVNWGVSDNCQRVSPTVNLTCFNPYNITVTKATYNTNYTNMTINSSMIMKILLGLTPSANSCGAYSGTGDLSRTCSDNCIDNTAIVGESGKTFSITGNSGTYIANTLISGFKALKVLATNCRIIWNKGYRWGTP